MKKTLTLTIINGPNEGRHLHASAGQISVVGRDSSSDFSVMDLRMSRRHFQVIGNNRDWQLKDLESTHGTLMNDKRVDEITIREGDVITAGDTKFLATFSDIIGSLARR